MELSGAGIVVTGGASGIGAATVAALRGAGARVAVLDRTPVPAGAADVALECDVADEPAVVDAVTRAVAALGRIDGAVLAAGVGGMASVLRMETAEWDRVLAVNLRGAFVSLRECARAMVAGGRPGAIVAVTSVSGFLADRAIAHYAVSKAGLAELVRVAARELGPKGICVNAVAPGTTDTPMFAATRENPGYRERVEARTPLGRIGAPAEVAAAVIALLGLGWVTGQVLAADGGVSLFSPIDPLDRGAGA